MDSITLVTKTVCVCLCVLVLITAICIWIVSHRNSFWPCRSKKEMCDAAVFNGTGYVAFDVSILYCRLIWALLGSQDGFFTHMSSPGNSRRRWLPTCVELHWLYSRTMLWLRLGESPMVLSYCTWHTVSIAVLLVSQRRSETPHHLLVFALEAVVWPWCKDFPVTHSFDECT